MPPNEVPHDDIRCGHKFNRHSGLTPPPPSADPADGCQIRLIRYLVRLPANSLQTTQSPT